MKFGHRCCPVAEKSHRRCSTGSVVLCSIRKPHDFFFFFLSKAVEDFISTRAFAGEGNGNPLQCSCLENPRDGGAWWAAIYGVTQSRTRLKRLSSSRAFAVVQLLSRVRLFATPRTAACQASLEPSLKQILNQHPHCFFIAEFDFHESVMWRVMSTVFF